MRLQIFGYAGCTTVKKAVTWATDNNLNPDYSHFNKVSDLKTALENWVDTAGIDAVFNPKAQTFKKLDLAEQNAITKSAATKIAAMATDPRFIKRPIGVSGDKVLSGFNLDEWEKAFA